MVCVNGSGAWRWRAVAASENLLVDGFPAKAAIPERFKFEAGPETVPATIAGAIASSKQLVEEWVSRFNHGDVEGLAALHAMDATDHQVVMEPLPGREAIHRMFRTEFGRAEMTCIVENLFEDGE